MSLTVPPTPDTSAVFMLVDDDGNPLGMADWGLITSRGTKLAFDVVAACDDNAALNQVMADTLNRAGVEAFGYVSACTVRVLAENIIAPLLDVCEAAGIDLRPGLRAIAAGELPADWPGRGEQP